jgi:flagellar operon protein
MVERLNRLTEKVAGATPQAPPASAPVKPGGPQFSTILREKAAAAAPPVAPPTTSALKFSAHAQDRMRSRSIALSAQEMKQLEQAVDKAAVKGARESLLLINNKAFVVSVKNRTVITAVDEASLKENVFTNIDSAVIM